MGKAGFIYELLFSDGKSYIGMTIKIPKFRYQQHRYSAKKGRSVLYVAWRKLGEPILKVIAEVPVELLAETEEQFVRERNTEFPKGYNTLAGGGMSPALCPIVAQKISKSRTGIVFSDEHILNLSLSHKGKPSPKKGIPMSEDQIQKLKDAWVTRRINHPFTDETKAKMSASGRRRPPPPPFSDETRAKMSSSRKAYFAAKKSSVATI